MKRILLVIFISLISFNSKAQEPSGTLARADSVACDGNGTAIIIDPGTNPCEFRPDIQKITFLRLDLCTAKPTAPTTSAALDRTNCATYFKNDSGAEVSVQQGGGTPIGTASDFSAVPYESYTHGVITMHPVFKYTSSVTFSDTMSDQTNSSTTCVTRPGSVNKIYNFHRSLSTSQSNVSCETGAVASEIKIGVNVLQTVEIGGADHCIHLLNFNGTNGIVAAYLLEADDTLHNDVPGTDIVPSSSDGCTSGTDNEISKVMGVMTLANPIEVTKCTKGIRIAYNNTQGLAIDLESDSKIYMWSPSFFDFSLQARQKSNAWC